MKKKLNIFCFAITVAVLAMACSKPSNNSTQPEPVKSRLPTIAELRFPGEFDVISSIGTTYVREVVEAGKLPRGSALLTGSGNLRSRGITAIIHAASGSAIQNEANFIPSLEGVQLSVKNSLILAGRFGHSRVAIPFIGGAIFLGRIGVSAPELARAIIRSALEGRGTLEVRFVTWSASDTQIFRDALHLILSEVPFQGLAPHIASVTQGDIVDFHVHEASAIVNAANMEVQFGGGISGAIGQATGQAAQINAEARAAIQRFNLRVLEML